MRTLTTDHVQTLDPDAQLTVEVIESESALEWEFDLPNIDKMARITSDVNGRTYLDKGQIQRLIKTLERTAKSLT